MAFRRHQSTALISTKRNADERDCHHRARKPAAGRLARALKSRFIGPFFSTPNAEELSLGSRSIVGVGHDGGGGDLGRVSAPVFLPTLGAGRTNERPGHRA